MYGLGALGAEGPGFVADFFVEEVRAAFRQCGIRAPSDAASLEVRHRDAWQFQPAGRQTG
jgi:hypothetical protein